MTPTIPTRASDATERPLTLQQQAILYHLDEGQLTYTELRYCTGGAPRSIRLWCAELIKRGLIVAVKGSAVCLTPAGCATLDELDAPKARKERAA
jgi:hypothetical protein